MANRYTLTEQQKVIDTYLKGCVNLYGFVTPRQFLKVYNRYNTPKIRKDDLLKYGMKLIRYSYDSYYIYSNAIVNKRVSDEKIGQIAYLQEGKKYYTPTREEILKYADPNYSPENEYTKALCTSLLTIWTCRWLLQKRLSNSLSGLCEPNSRLVNNCTL